MCLYCGKECSEEVVEHFRKEYQKASALKEEHFDVQVEYVLEEATGWIH